MIKPMNGMLLVKQEVAEDKVVGGIVIPMGLSETGPKRGVIKEVGDGEANHFTGGWLTMDNFAIGDTVMYPDHSGTQVEDGGEKYILIHNKYILAKIVE